MAEKARTIEFVTRNADLVRQVALELGIGYALLALPGEKYTTESGYKATLDSGHHHLRITLNPHHRAEDFWSGLEVAIHTERVKRFPVAAARLKAYVKLDVFSDLDMTDPELTPTTSFVEKEAFVHRQPFEFLADKDFSFEAARRMTRTNLAGQLFTNLVLREANVHLAEQYNTAFSRVDSSVVGRYTGTEEENAAIDASIFHSRFKHDKRRTVSRPGASREFKLGSVDRYQVERAVGNTPIVVLGAGPAGIMATRSLMELGVPRRNIAVVDASGEYGGIWKQKNVAGGSKNNPFPFLFEGVGLEKAPGSGETVVQFLQTMANDSHFRQELPRVVKGVVDEVFPGDLNHICSVKVDGRVEVFTAPIMINTLGTGRPVEPSRLGVMTTDTPEAAGIRWQQIWSTEQAERYRGKRLVFVGLGNSTAEMLAQVQKFNREGFNIDYRVLTHYPAEVVNNPEDTVVRDGVAYRVFRDLSKPVLTSWEGDLPEARETYFSALRDGNIISDVTHWDRHGSHLSVVTTQDQRVNIEVDQQFTLIGYGNSESTLGAYGMHMTDSGTVARDYDGEIQKPNGSDGRIYKGYYGLGAILKSDMDPNAIVMPGMMHRMYDMMFGVMMRTQEYRLKRGA